MAGIPNLPGNQSSLFDVLQRTIGGALPQGGIPPIGNPTIDWLTRQFTEQMAATGVPPPSQPVPPPVAAAPQVPPNGGLGNVPGTQTPMTLPSPTGGAPVMPSGTSTAWMGGGGAAPAGTPSTPPATTPAQENPLAKAMSELSQVQAPASPDALRAGTPSLPSAKQIDLSPLLSLMAQINGPGGGAKPTQLPFLTNFLGTAPQR